mmetsp:Transcript_52213/g.123612  ORF Transcript_52213/g.123612 Transcript_52213/m.123612 type:complete len:160 (-) Transcript_52213:265-744(-)
MLSQWFGCCERREFEDAPAKEQTTPRLAPSNGAAGGLISPHLTQSLCGVGINFRADTTGALFVSSLTPDGPAAQKGEVMVNDILAEVDGKSVHRSPLSHISKYLLGPEHTTARIKFLRNGNIVAVEIERAPVASLLCVRRIADDPKTAFSPSDGAVQVL